MAEPHPPASPVVILVDDDQAVLASLKFALELDGYRVTAHAGGDSLLGEAELPAAGCLVVDLALPGGRDGLELIAALRRRGVRLPAILMTSHPSAATQSRAGEAGVPIVEKPLLGQALLDAIRAALAA